jgi:hypothetical protein
MQGGEDNQSQADEHELSHTQAPVGRAHNISDEYGGQLNVAADAEDDNVVTWEASEYIHHQKSAGWFTVLGLAALILSGGIYLLTRDWFSVGVLILMAVTVGIFAGRPPQTRRYSLSHSGLSIGDKHYPLDGFRTFSLAQEGAILSITFMPTKRFMVPVTVYFSQEDEPKIMEVLGNTLPHEERPPDIIDRWSSRLRF